MEQTLNRESFAGFERWYTLGRVRSTGQNPSPETLRTKLIQIVRAARTLGHADEESFGRAMGNRQNLGVLIEELHASISTGSVRQAVYALTDFGKYAEHKGWVEHHAVEAKDVPPRNPQTAITLYTPSEIEMFLYASRAKGLRWYAFMAFLIKTGRRVGEALSLEWDWFRMEHVPPYVDLPFNKARVPQVVPLGKYLVNTVFTPANMLALKSMENGRTFQRDPARHPFPWAYPTVHSRLETFCDVTGLPNHGFHAFRHTNITDRLARGVPIQAVAALAGHRSIQTTDRRYNWLQPLQVAHYVEDE